MIGPGHDWEQTVAGFDIGHEYDAVLSRRKLEIYQAVLSPL